MRLRSLRSVGPVHPTDVVDFSYTDVAAMLATSADGFCRRNRGLVEAPAPEIATLWSGLSDLDIFRVAGAESAAEIVAALMETFGHVGCPGPLTATFLATSLFEGAETGGETGKEAEAVAGGRKLVSVGTPPLLAWAPLAEVFVELDGENAYLCRVVGAVEPVDTLSGEPWGRCALERTDDLGDASRGLSLGDIAVAAYLVGAGEELLAIASGYAADRKQFGRAIGDFQSVAHPLVDASIALRAARTLTRRAAFEWDEKGPFSRVRAATARLSATEAALDIAYRAHQTLGAIGFTVEGPIGRLSKQVRQVSLTAPGPVAARQVVERQLVAKEQYD